MLIGRGTSEREVKETEAVCSVCSGSAADSGFSGKPGSIVRVDPSVVCCHGAVKCVVFFSLGSYLEFNFLMMACLAFLGHQPTLIMLR